MANPQVEDGYTKIANAILEAMARTNFTAYQSRVIAALWRKTYGYHKKMDRVPNSQIVEMTGLHKAHVCRTICELKLRNVVTQVGNCLMFQKDYEQWRELPSGATPYRKPDKKSNTSAKKLPSGATSKKLPSGATRVTPLGNKKLPSGADSKERKKLSKEITMLTRKSKTPDSRVHDFFKFWGEIYQEFTKEKYLANFQKEGNLIKKLLALDDLPRLKELAIDFFLFPNEWMQDKGRGINLFWTQIDQLKTQAHTEERQAFKRMGMRRQFYERHGIRVE